MAEGKIIVSLQQGSIVGKKSKLPNGDDCAVFKGIPYAKPPVGELRFKPPVPLEAFPDDPLECLADGPCSHSDDVRFERKSEDCLYLNVFSPDVQPSVPFPVLVWIHGGGFYTGTGHSALHDPEYLVQQGAVVVTINYRLGPLGFLALPSVGVTGNQGLKDQRMSFRWVRKNIDRFGGDPDNVTLFGESAGGASVHLHYLSEDSRQYFHKAIVQSGTAFNEWVWQREPEVRARKLAILLGAPEGCTDEEALATLMSASAEEMTALQNRTLSEREQAVILCFPFTPVVEKAEQEGAIITTHPTEAAKASFRREIPLILGSTSDEGLLLWTLAQQKLPFYQNEPTAFIPTTLRIRSEEEGRRAAERIQQFFFNGQPLSSENLKSITSLLGDNLNTFAGYAAAELHVLYQSAPLYLYVFSFLGELNVYREEMKVPPELEGAAHADELYYLFSSTLYKTATVANDSRAARFRDYFCRLWVNFARTGNPNEPNWTPVERPSPGDVDDFYPPAFDMNTPEGGAMTVEFFRKRFQFWKRLYQDFNGSHLLPSIESVEGLKEA